MKERLIKLLENSRSDYFKFPVSACLVTNDGKAYYGVNVETSSPAAGICAERNALFSGITYGLDPNSIIELHVMSNTGVFPCFICRQALVDYLKPNVKVFIYNKDGITEETTVKDLTPSSFSRSNL